MIFAGSDLHAQLRKKPDVSSKSKKEKANQADRKPIYEHLGGELLFGNLGFFNGLSVSTKLSLGYKITSGIALGGGTKLFYDQYSVVGPDPSVFDIGGFFMGRARIYQDIYFKAEYAFMRYEKDPDGYSIRNLYENVSVNYPLVGLGYMSGAGKWKFGVELMYIANETAQDIQSSVIEYWFGANYNF
mgnify:CR=1 FL=1